MSLVTGQDSLRFATSIDNSGLTQGTIEAQGILREFASNISQMDIFAGLAIGAGIAFSSIATDAYNLSKDYEASMKEIQTVSDATNQDFQGMSDSIAALANEVPQTALELSRAFYEIAGAGYDGAAGLQLLEVSGKAAIGGVTDVRTAADGLTTIMNAWKMSASEAEYVTDQLFQTVKLGKTTFPQLAGNISDVASIAASAKIPLNQILASIASMTKQGIPTSQAFTQIRMAIMSTNKVLGDGWAKTKTFQEAMQAVNDKAGGSQVQLTKLVGSVEALNAVLALSGGNAKMAADDLKSVTDSAGAAGNAFEIMMQSADNQQKMLANNIQAAFRPLGDFLLKNFTDMAQFLNEAFKSGDIEKFAKIVGTAVAALVAYKSAVAISSISLADLKAGINSANIAMKALNLTAKVNPLGLLVAGLTAAVTAFIAFKDKSDVASEAIKNFNDELGREQEQLNGAFEALKATTKGSQERKELIEEINKEYGKYLPNLLTEASNLNDIEIAQLGANIALEKSIALKIREQSIADSTSKYVKTRAAAVGEIIALATRENKYVTKQAAKDLNDLIDISIQAGEANEDLITKFAKKYDTEKFMEGREFTLKQAVDKVVEAYKEKSAELTNITAAFSGYDDAQEGSYKTELMNLRKLKKEQLWTEEKYLQEKQKLLDKYNLDEFGNPKKTKPTGTTTDPVKPTGDPTKPKIDKKEIKEDITYLDQLRNSVEALKKGLEDMGKFEIDTEEITIQQEAIKNLEDEIIRQEKILGISKEQAKEAKKIHPVQARTLEYLYQQLNAQEELYYYAQSTEERTRISQEIKLLQESIDKVYGIKAGKKELYELDLKTLMLMRQSIKEEMEGIDQETEAYKDFANLQIDVNKEITKIVSGYLAFGADALGSLANSLGEVNDDLGQMLSSIAQVAKDTAGILQGLATGNYVQVATSAIDLIVKLFTIRKRKREKEEKEHQERVKAIIEEQNIELEKQINLIDKAKGIDLYSQYEKSFNEITQSLKEIRELSGGMGKPISNDFLDQYNELLDKQKELRQQLYADLTGTTSESISDSILEGFANGETAAKDFAGTFEDLMKQAILNSFKLKFLDKQFDNFYAAFGEAAESGQGLTETEIAGLKEQFNKNIATAKQGFEEFNSLFEETFGTALGGGTTSTKQGLAGEIKASLTEETGTVLAGTINSIRLYVAENTEVFRDMNQKLSAIALNTSYNKELRRLEKIESLLATQGQLARSAGI